MKTSHLQAREEREWMGGLMGAWSAYNNLLIRQQQQWFTIEIAQTNAYRRIGVKKWYLIKHLYFPLFNDNIK